MSEDSTKQDFLTELDAILESDEAYGSNIQVLTYSVKDEVVSGKFRDSWNNRVYEFIIDIDGISYKPAAKFDSFSEDELPVRFDAYSKGYGSLLSDVRLDRNPIGKRVKKPKCGTEGYGCGYSCIGLLKTCRILSSGKKTRGEQQGKAIGKERISKLMDLAVKLAASGDKKKFAAVNAVGARLKTSREKYTEGGKIKMAQRQPPIKEVEKVEVVPKTQAKQPAKSKTETATNPKTHSIKSQKEFEEVMFHVIDKVNKEGKHNGLVPIHEIRKAIGELVPRNKFKEFTQKMVSDESIIAIGGEMKGINPERKSNSLLAPSGQIRYYVKLAPDGEKRSEDLTTSQHNNVDKLLKDRPELDPLGTARQYAKGKTIESQKEFETILTNVFKSLNDDFSLDNLVPIAQVREILKDRISKDDFDKMMQEAQDNGYRLIGGGYDVSDKLKKGGIKTKLGNERHYIQKES